MLPIVRMEIKLTSTSLALARNELGNEISNCCICSKVVLIQRHQYFIQALVSLFALRFYFVWIPGRLSCFVDTGQSYNCNERIIISNLKIIVDPHNLVLLYLTLSLSSLICNQQSVLFYRLQSVIKEGHPRPHPHPPTPYPLQYWEGEKYLFVITCVIVSVQLMWPFKNNLDFFVQLEAQA